VVAVANRRSGAYPARQLLECALNGVRVIDSATFFEREACQIRVDSLQPSYWKTVRTLKDALDPLGIIAPGRYEPGRAR
jgi:hypothetical protein